MKFRIFLLPLLLICQHLCSKPPSLTPRDTRGKIEEILKAHVCYQQLTPELVGRAMQNFIEELDPGKTYFLEPELVTWTNPEDELLKTALHSCNNAEFTPFIDIHRVMISAIKRRNALEKEIEFAPQPENVQISEFKDLKWCKSEEELKERLLRIKTLQSQTMTKIDPEARDLFLQRVAKRRINRENEIMGSSSAEQQQTILSYTLKAITGALDSQTNYFTPAEANQFMIQVQQRLFGIGAQLRDDLSGFSITRLVEGGPAHLGNALKVGDRVVAVNQTPVVGMDIFEAVELIRGPEGSNVTLTVLRETKEGENTKEEKLDIDILRGEVVLKESRLESYYEPYGKGVIAVLHLFSFYQDSNSSSAADIKQALLDIQKEHSLKGVVLDLRGNSGGLLPQAVAVTSLFISKGVVVSIKDNTGAVQHLHSIDGEKIWDGPLLVLTNRMSASAAEIVAQTLQDYGRAFVVGDEESFGKGTFQTFTLESTHFGKVNPKGEYKVTRGRYYTVSGKSPQLNGVKADIVIPGLFSEEEIGEKFSKFPLATDEIAPNFHTNPSRFSRLIHGSIGSHRQTVITTYKSFLEPLKFNSQARIAQNKNYQKFLERIKQDGSTHDLYDFMSYNDLQMTETLNVMKDLIFLTQRDP